MPKGLGLFKGTGGGGSTDAWLLTGNTGTDPNTDFVGTTDGARLSILGGNPSNADEGVSIQGDSQSKEGVSIKGDSDSGEGVYIDGASGSKEGVQIKGGSDSIEGVYIEGDSPPSIASAIHLKNTGSGGGIRLSGIGEGSNKILVSWNNSGDASWVSPNVAVFNFNEYISDAAADADVTLPSGGLYKLTGGRTIFQKP